MYILCLYVFKNIQIYFLHDSSYFNFLNSSDTNSNLEGDFTNKKQKTSFNLLLCLNNYIKL